MTLHGSFGKYVTVTMCDGLTYSGKVDMFTPRYDDPEERASICIDNYIFFEDEIVKSEEETGNHSGGR